MPSRDSTRCVQKSRRQFDPTSMAESPEEELLQLRRKEARLMMEEGTVNNRIDRTVRADDGSDGWPGSRRRIDDWPLPHRAPSVSSVAQWTSRTSGANKECQVVAMAQSVPPGDIDTQPGTKIVFRSRLYLIILLLSGFVNCSAAPSDAAPLILDDVVECVTASLGSRGTRFSSGGPYHDQLLAGTDTSLAELQRLPGHAPSRLLVATWCRVEELEKIVLRLTESLTEAEKRLAERDASVMALEQAQKTTEWNEMFVFYVTEIGTCLLSMVAGGIVSSFRGSQHPQAKLLLSIASVCLGLLLSEKHLIQFGGGVVGRIAMAWGAAASREVHRILVVIAASSALKTTKGSAV